MTICVCPFKRTKQCLLTGQENMSPGPEKNGLLHSALTSPGLHGRAIQAMYWSGEEMAPDITNPTWLKGTVLEVVES